MAIEITVPAAEEVAAPGSGEGSEEPAPVSGEGAEEVAPVQEGQAPPAAEEKKAED